METIQDLQFELMRRASFNDFDGESVVNTLKAHRDLWKGAIMNRDDLISLRDISQDYWNVDTLYLTPVPGKEEELEQLAVDEFNADAVNWMGGDAAALQLGHFVKASKTVLVCWWD